MARIFVIVCAVLGAAFLISRIFPTTTHVAFQVAGLGITWLMLVSAGVGFMTYKVTK